MVRAESIEQTWRKSQSPLLVIPLICLILVLVDLPRWLEVVGLVAIVALVAASAALLRRSIGGWLPSETIGRVDDR